MRWEGPQRAISIMPRMSALAVTTHVRTDLGQVQVWPGLTWHSWIAQQAIETLVGATGALGMATLGGVAEAMSSLCQS
jgi:hypothetical protein